MFSKALCAFGLCVLSACAANASPPSTRALTLLVIGPTRAQLSSSPESPGYARLRTLLTAEQERAQHSLISVSVGDMFYGSGPAAWSRGEVVLEPFAALGIDVCAPGSRDGLLGRERAAALLEQLPCALESSTRVHASTPLPAATLERAGVQVRFVQLAADDSAAPSHGAPLDAASLARVRAALQAEREPDRGAVRVLISDLATDQARELARRAPGFDVILAAGGTAGVAGVAVEHDTLVVTPGELASGVGRLELTVSRAEGRVLRHAFRTLLVAADAYAEDPSVRAIVERALAPYRERAGRTVARDDMPLGRARYTFIADALREAANADVALIPVIPLIPWAGGNTPPQGVLTQAELWTRLPFDGPLTRRRVEGQALRAAVTRWRSSAALDELVFSGLRVRADTDVIEVGGHPLRDADSYWVTAPGLTLAAAEPAEQSSTMTMHEALERYLEAHPFLRATPEGDVVAESLPSSVQCKDQLRRR